MRAKRLIAAGAAVATVTLLTTWVIAADARGEAPSGRFEPASSLAWTFAGPDAERLRNEAIATAALRLGPADPQFGWWQGSAAGDPLAAPLPACRFVPTAPTGTSPKFDCVFDGGQVVKVKYGRNPELHAEVAATRLLHLLGYAADDVRFVPRLRCYGCPRYPFLTMRVLSLALAADALEPHGHEQGYTDFEWVTLERKFPAPPIETETQEGWAFWELDRSRQPAEEADALRLLAVFLAHWDNKASNQRLVCLDPDRPAPDAPCTRPLAMLQDLGATFGPAKVNLARWRDLPVWHDRATCTVSMRAMPFFGGTFADARISEAGRARLATQLAGVSDLQVRRLLTDARFGPFHSGTDDRRDLDAWTEAFRHRANQIVEGGPCAG